MERQEIGKAYAFFDCHASKERIEEELPCIRESALTPRELELSLIENSGQIDGDEELKEIVKGTYNANVRYIMQAKCPNRTNKKTADELADILNHAYASDLYVGLGNFRRWIFYEDKGEYVERE